MFSVPKYLNPGVINIHLAANKILEKSIKNYPVVVGSYSQWIVSNSGRKSAMDANIMATKLKDTFLLHLLLLPRVFIY